MITTDKLDQAYAPRVLGLRPEQLPAVLLLVGVDNQTQLLTGDFTLWVDPRIPRETLLDAIDAARQQLED